MPVTKTFRGASVDPGTYDALVELAAITGSIYIDPIDGYGSYRSNKASGGTDTGGGHCDINAEGMTDAEARRVETLARSIGFVAWFRPRYSPYTGKAYGWQRHIHLIRRDCADLSAAAKAQVKDYDDGWDGLAVRHKDTGSRAYVGMTWAKYLAAKDAAAKKTTTTIAAKEADMSLTPNAIWGADIITAPEPTKENPNWTPASYLIWGYRQATSNFRAITSRLANIEKTLSSIAAKVGAPVDIDEKAIAAGVVAAMSEDVRAAVAEAVQAGAADGDAPDAKTIADAVVSAIGTRLGAAA